MVEITPYFDDTLSGTDFAFIKCDTNTFTENAVNWYRINTFFTSFKKKVTIMNAFEKSDQTALTHHVVTLSCCRWQLVLYKLQLRNR